MFTVHVILRLIAGIEQCMIYVISEFCARISSPPKSFASCEPWIPLLSSTTRILRYQLLLAVKPSSLFAHPILNLTSKTPHDTPITQDVSGRCARHQPSSGHDGITSAPSQDPSKRSIFNSILRRKPTIPWRQCLRLLSFRLNFDSHRLEICLAEWSRYTFADRH